MAIVADVEAIRFGQPSLHEQVLKGDFLDPWRVAVACICIRRTSGDRAAPFVHTLLSMFPTPKMFLQRADSETVAHILRPLGLSNVRERAIRAATVAFFKDPASMWDVIGPYTRDAIRLVVGKRIDPPPIDKVLVAVRDRMVRLSTTRHPTCYP